MAVYKATYCYPLQDSLDIRVVPSESDGQPSLLLKCKIDTSNKKVTGYKIRVLDDNNNVIFPYDKEGKISPISELEQSSDSLINSGINGTFLNIPFFQNNQSKKLQSYNAVYYTPSYSANYYVDSSNVTQLVGGSNISVSSIDSDAIVGETIYVYDNSEQSKSGIWKIISFDGTTYICENKYAYSQVNDKYVVILNGSQHNILYRNGAVTDAYRWVNIIGESIDFDVNKNNYKWEITLYQGDIDALMLRGTDPKYVDYWNSDNTPGASKLPYDWYDNILNQGTILGSTNKRIQIADKPSDYAGDDISLPSGNILEPIVLQEKWVQLLDNSNNQLGQRQYVQTYDATMGHVYPISTGFTLDEINNPNATKVCFYKHSNRIEDILAKDIVDVATITTLSRWDMWGIRRGKSDNRYQFYNITEAFSLYGVSYEANNIIWWYNGGSNSRWIKITNKGEVEDEDSLPTSGQQTGDMYTVHDDFETVIWIEDMDYWYFLDPVTYIPDAKMSDLPLGSIDNIPLSQSLRVLVKDAWDPVYNGVWLVQDNAFWTRSGSYDTWGELIGAILFVEKGTQNGGKNFQSLVSAGGQLKDSLATSSDTDGYSPVFFSEEEPEVLYIDQLTNTVDAFSGKWADITITSPGGSAEIVDINSDSDGVPYKIGQTLLVVDAQDKYFIIAISAIDTSADPVEISWTVVEELDLTNNNYIRILNGKVWGGKVVVPDSLTADLISVSSDLSTAYIQKNTVNYTFISPYIGLEKGMALYLLNSKYATVSGVPTSWIDVKDFNSTVWKVKTPTLDKPFDSAIRSSTDIGVPYQYEIRGFFKTSDENPFVTIEYPYIKIYSNGEVVQPVYDTIQRYVELEGSYIQFQQASWESYRWVLTDSYGNVLQDTGKKFDKELKVKFYGLTSNYNVNQNRWESNYYNVLLEIEDSLNNTLSYNFEIRTTVETVASTNVNFYADFDCSTHSVKLSYEDSGLIYAVTPQNSDEIAKYIDGNPYWDNSLIYENNQMTITEPNNNTDVPVFNIYDNNTEDNKHPEFSYTVVNGVEYSHYFGSKESVINKNDKTFSLDRIIDSSGVIEGSVIQECIQYQLSNNYCGEIFDFTVDFKVANVDHSLTFSLIVPDSTTTNPFQLNSNRNRYIFQVSGHTGSSDYVKNCSTNIAFCDLGTNVVLNLIPANIVPDIQDTEYLPYSGTIDMNQVAWYKKVTNESTGQSIYLNSQKPLGNLCLFDNIVGSDIATGGSTISLIGINAPSYWVEQGRGELVFKNEDNSLENGVNGVNLVKRTNNTLIQDDDFLVWPSATDEANYSWIEPDVGNNYPNSWSDLVTPIDQISSWKVAPRHFMTDKIWTVKISLLAEELKQLFDHINDLDNLSFDTTGTAKLSINSGATEYGSLQIINFEG